MSLPTSMTTESIEYVVVPSGNSNVGGGTAVTFTVPVITDSGTLQEAATEAFLAAVESGLQTMADSLDAITGISNVYIFRNYKGSTGSTDIRS